MIMLTKAFAMSAALLAGGCLLSPSAFAQLNPGGGPIEITADRGELNDVQREAVYIGNVDVVQGPARLRASKVVISYKATDETNAQSEQSGFGSGVGGLKTIVAEGEVYYITEKEKVKAKHGLYDADKNTITLKGDVRVTNQEGVVASETLVIQVDTGRYVMDGGSGRVRTVIDPQDETQTIQ